MLKLIPVLIAFTLFLAGCGESAVGIVVRTFSREG